jgi:hypothetical protein
MHPAALAALHVAVQAIRSMSEVVECAADNDSRSGEIYFVLNSGETYGLKLAETDDESDDSAPPQTSTDEPTPNSHKEELDQLAHTIALEDCVAILESEASMVREDDIEWWNLSEPGSIPEHVDPAQRYLELRGLLVRHPEHSTWIRVLDPEEEDK